MKIRTRLTLWYAAILSLSLIVMGAGVFRELHERIRQRQQGLPEDDSFNEACELVFEVGLPSIVVGLAGGWWLTRRALSPVRTLIGAVRGMDETSLKQPLARSRNGDELDQLTEVLNAANARLDESFSRIREFTLHASHELKTPLTVMRHDLETLLHEDNLPASHREHVLSQLDEVQRLSQIVSGLTLLAKADAGQVPIERRPVRLDELVQDACEDAVNLGDNRGLKVLLSSCATVTVSGDRDRLRQLLLNLVDNAVKYSDLNGSITVRLTRLPGEAEFTISNSGPGLPPEVLPRVFDRFYRGDAAHNHSAIEGCGLGLSIAKWIVSAHGGTIKLDSAPGKVTTVTVRLPAMR